MLDTFDKNAKAGREALAAAKDEDFPVIWSLKNTKGDTIMAMPRAACYRGMVMSHMIHHRAQLGVYLRLNEIEIPGMYGPSADEMKFWQDKARKAECDPRKNATAAIQAGRLGGVSDRGSGLKSLTQGYRIQENNSVSNNSC